MEIDKVAQDAINLISEKFRNLKTLNIIIAGKTGVGKSTLINSVFREKLAETGTGRPVTDHMRKLTKKGVPLAIYDTPGFELGKEVQTEVKKEIVSTITQCYAKSDINETIHCLWYCVNTASNRIEPEEIDWIRELSKDGQMAQVPIIIVLTQAFSKPNADKMRKALLTTIGEGAFGGCLSLNIIVIPDSLTSIGDDAFYYCLGLSYLSYNGITYDYGTIDNFYRIVNYG